MKDLENLAELFTEAYDFIYYYGLKLYVIKIEPSVMFGKKIKLQGELIPNCSVLNQLNFVDNEENNWYTYQHNNIELTLTYE